MRMTDQAISIVEEALSESARVKAALREQSGLIVRMAELVVETYRGGGRLYACGNGGSACDAMHLVEELVARYKRDRPGLAAHHLLDSATLTCWSNDYEFATVFSRQVETMARPGDVLVAISTSGNSENVVRAIDAAAARGVVTLGLTGGDGGRMKGLCTETLIVPSAATERIQEAHIAVIHLLCELVELSLFPEPPRS